MAQVAVIIFLCSIILGTVYGGCGQYKATDGSIYELDALTTTVDYSGTDPSQRDFIYYWNFCKFLSGSGCSTNPPNAYAGQVYQGNCVSLGYQYTVHDGKNGPRNGVQITYTNDHSADKCPGNKNRVVNLVVNCASGIEASLDGIGESGGHGSCIYDITMKSKHGCPTNAPGTIGGLSGGWVFVIIVLVGATVYLLVGILVKWKVMHAEPGPELIPNIDFWRELPGLLKDGCFFVKGKLTGGSYSSL